MPVWGMNEIAQIELSAAKRAELEADLAKRNSLQKRVWRASIVLLTADRQGIAEIIRRTGKAKTDIWRWQKRFGPAQRHGVHCGKSNCLTSDVGHSLHPHDRVTSLVLRKPT